MPSAEEVVEVGSSTAKAVVSSRIDASELADLDVTVTFEDGQLEVDVYVNAPESHVDEQSVADDAALAARAAVDELFAEE